MKKSLKNICISGAMIFGMNQAASADVMMHAFNWNYADVTTKAQEISDLGYKSVLVSPPYLSNPSTQWWARYQPLDYRILSGPLGNKAEFTAMISALQSKGINLYVDVIFNHMANMGQTKGAESYPGFDVSGAFYQENRLYGDLSQRLFGAEDFHDGSNAKCISDYNNWYDSTWNRLCGGAGDVGLPDLKGEATDGSGQWIRDNQITYLNALKDLGVSGFRIDAVKHMKWEHLNDVFNSDVLDGVHAFAEIISHSNEDDAKFLQPFLDNANANFGAYDFRLFNDIDHALDINGSMANLGNPNTLPNDRAVTFVITHDMPQNDGFNGFLFSDTDEKLAYGYILGRDGGVPLVYTDHNETTKFNSRWVDAYKNTDIKNMINFHNEVQATDMQVLATSNCVILFRRGDKGLVGINKCGNAESHSVNVSGLNLGNYNEQLTGTNLSINAAQQTISVPARSVRMWLNTAITEQNWYFSGTANNWNASQLTKVNDTYEIEVTFANGDANGGPRYKIRQSSTDWAINFPATDMLANANTTYKVSFNPNSQTVSHVIVSNNNGGSCPITFRCENGNTQMGDSVYAIGSIEALGNWNSENAAVLSPTNYPTWEETLNLPKNTDISWKCIVRQETSPFTVRQWEVDPNNSFNTGNCETTSVTGGL